MAIKHNYQWWHRLQFRLPVIFIISLSLFLFVAFQLIQTGARAVLEKRELQNIELSSRAIVEELQNKTAVASSLASAMASVASTLPNDEASYHNVFKHLLKSSPRQHLIAGGGIWPEPYLFNPNKERNSFFWGKDQLRNLQFFDNYNDADGNGYHHEAWYVPSRYQSEGNLMWSGSYVDPYSLEPMVTVTVPFFKNEQFSGVTTVDMNLFGLDELVKSWASNFGGYAFVVDRNGKLISKLLKHVASNDNSFPNLAELSKNDPSFVHIQDAVFEYTAETLLDKKSSGFEGDLQSRIAQNSYQISEVEAELISAILQQPKDNNRSEHFKTTSFKVSSAPFLNEESFVSITGMQDTHWKIITVMPYSHITQAVGQGIEQLLWPLITMAVLCILFIYLFVHIYFIKRITAITSQLSFTNDVTATNTQMSIQTDDQGELGTIVRLFNDRTHKLRQLTDALSTSKLELEARVEERTQKLNDSLKRLDIAFAAAHQGWFDLNLATGELSVSNEYPKIFGYTSSEFQTSLQQWQQSIHPDEREYFLNTFEQSQKTSVPTEIEYRQKTKNGNWLWLHTIGEIIEWDTNNIPSRMIGIHTNITDRKRNEIVLRALAEMGSSENENEDIFKTIVHQLALSHNMRYAFIGRINPDTKATMDTLAIWSDNGFIENISCSLKGTPNQKVIEDGVSFYSDNVQELFPQSHFSTEMKVVSYLGVALKDHHQNVLGVLALLDDKSMTDMPQTLSLLNSLAMRASIEFERKASEERQELSARIFKETHEAILITNVEGIIIDANPTFSDITGYTRDEVIGKNPRILNSGRQSPSFYADMWESIADLGHWQGELWNRKKNGDIFAEMLTISALKDEHGNTSNYICLFSDITQSKKQQEQLELMAHYDVLTQLPNRVLFSDRFTQAIAHSKRTGTLLAVCFLDLDNFKSVNDSYGHEVGDKLLVKVAKRIKITIRDEDTVSRQGGDEFALLLGDLNSFSECEKMLDRLHYALSQSYLIGDKILNISASSGIALYPGNTSDLDTLLRHADQAMYQAKLAGRNRYHLFNHVDEHQAIEKQNQIQEISQALIKNQLQLYYQPKVNMRTGDVFGAEALIRWIHPDKGLIPPLDFLPAIDGTDLEIKVSKWVINEALSQLEAWHKNNIKLEISINVSAYHLLSESFIAELNAALSKYPSVNSKYFHLEILESTALGDLDAISTIIKTCKDSLGIRVALDDFGTGYSSLVHLRNLPADTIKIDQTFVRDMLDDPSDAAIIDAITGLSDSFNRELIAEGVETTNHGLMLLMMGCEEAQGYGIAKPMPVDNFMQWLEHYTPNQEWLQCGHQYRSAKETKVKLFRLVSEHWKTIFIKNIESSPDNIQSWPIMSTKRCSCGSWIQRAEQEQLFELDCIENLKQAHEMMHSLAHSIQLKYQDGEIQSAQSFIPEFQAAFNNVSSTLESCK